MGAGYFSTAQWQELELQALIFRHMIAGADIPTQLLHLVKKSLVAASPPPPYYISNPLHQYHPHYQPAARKFTSSISHLISSKWSFLIIFHVLSNSFAK